MAGATASLRDPRRGRHRAGKVVGGVAASKQTAGQWRGAETQPRGAGVDGPPGCWGRSYKEGVVMLGEPHPDPRLCPTPMLPSLCLFTHHTRALGLTNPHDLGDTP